MSPTWFSTNRQEAVTVYLRYHLGGVPYSGYGALFKSSRVRKDDTVSCLAAIRHITELEEDEGGESNRLQKPLKKPR